MSSKKNTLKGDESNSPLLTSKKKNKNSSKAKRKFMKSSNEKSEPNEANSLLSASKKETPKSLKPKSNIAKKSLNKNTKIGESSSPLSLSKKTTLKSPKTESKIVSKSSNENSIPSKPKETQKSQNLVKTPNEKSKLVNTKETQKPQKKKPEAAKGLYENPGKVKEVKSSSMAQPRKEDMKTLGGFIFMCNAKTKRDCYQYRVMGVHAHKKEIVMGVKPGMKLFLFDFDVKLLYGIYKASSAGGMNLEPAAFGGAFPSQVRFEVHKDCLPLPESVFKKAIKESYNERTRKFKTELTVDQVKKLTDLFKPAPSLHSNPQPVVIHEPRRPSEQETVHFPNPTLASPQLLLTEQEYRNYGLRGDRHKNVTTPVGPPTYDPYKPDPEREAARPDKTLFLSEQDYRTYGLKGRQDNHNPASLTPNIDTTNPVTSFYQPDTYNSYHQNPSLVDRYLSQPLSTPSSYYGYDTTHVENQFHHETDRVERFYSVNASNALTEYNQTASRLEREPEYISAPVSSRYAFAGPSVTYRI